MQTVIKWKHLHVNNFLMAKFKWFTILQCALLVSVDKNKQEFLK